MIKTSLSGKFIFTLEFRDAESIDDMIATLNHAKGKGIFPFFYATERDFAQKEPQ